MRLGRRFYYFTFKSNLSYSLALVVLRILGFFLRPLSLRAKHSFGWLIGSLWYMLDFVNRELCRRDMALALGKTHSVSVRRRALRRSMANVMAYHAESYFTSALTRDELLGMVTNPEWSRPLVEALKEGKGAVVATAHFSNFGLLCYFISACGRTSLIAKYQRVFNDIMVRHREAMNVGTLNEHQTSYDMLLELLRRNETILITIDRPLKRVKGVHVSLFGHRVLMPYYPADLSRLSGAPIFFAVPTRSKGEYTMHFEGPMRVPAEMDERESREQYTQLLCSKLESYIAAYPHEWNWQYKRFTKKHWGVPRY
jgi:lauroyl/myristoyl acyltransferase